MPGALKYVGPSSYQNIVLQAAQTVTASGTGTAVSGLGEFHKLNLQAAITAAAAAAGDKLDLYVQTTIDGTNWIDIYRFAQVLGNGGTKRYYGKILWNSALTEFENGTALSAASARHIVGDSYRCRWVVTNVGPFLAFTGTGPYTVTGVAGSGLNAGGSPFDLSVAASNELSISITDDGAANAVVAAATRPSSSGEWAATVGTITRASFTFSVVANVQA